MQIKINNDIRHKVADALWEAPFNMLETSHADFNSRMIWFYDTLCEAAAAYVPADYDPKSAVQVLSALIEPNLTRARVEMCETAPVDIKCPKCGSFTNDTSYAYCPRCGADLHDEPIYQPEQ